MRQIGVLAVVAAMAACGGAARDDFSKATPSFDALALDIGAADAVPENFDASASGAQSLTAADAAQAAVDDPCHPHLFLRAHSVVAATNGSIWRVLRPIRRIIPFSPRRRDGGTHVWERVVDGFDYRYSIVKTADHSFTATLQVKKVADPDTSFVTVYDAAVQRDPSNHDGSGTAKLDLDKLASVTGDAVSGQLTLDFTATPADKKVLVTMVNLKVNSDLPRNGHSVFFKQTGKGGSLKFVDDLTLRCTGQTPAAPGTTPVTAVARWIVASDGVHFRGDAGAAGGQIPANRKWEAVTCAQGHDPRETYWMVKLEDASSVPPGATVFARTTQSTVATAAACDPAFGAVPSIDGSANDYDFSKVDFTSDDPLPFP
jgi:hypothetical protein